MTYFGGLQRFSSARSASMPAASIFAQVAGVSRMVRCTKCSSGGFGGLPRGRLGSSMPRTVAPIYEDSNNPCNVDLSDYNKYINRSANMDRKQTHTTGAGYFGTDKPGTTDPFITTEVLTHESWDERLLASKFMARTRTDDFKALDLSIEEYVGEKRRAKLVSVRLEEPAARALYKQLHARFGGSNV